MIHYQAGWLGVNPHLLMKLTGSVAPKGLFWAIPASGMAFGLFHVWKMEIFGPQEEGSNTVVNTYSGYSFILGFLIIFRMEQAYTRFWEACTLANELRAEWIDAVQSCIAFCTEKPELQEEVEKFQHYLIRLVSMLHRAALERLALSSHDEFPCFDLSGLSKIKYLSESPDRCECIFQWIMKTIVRASKNGVIEIPPPILGRAFEEMSTGMAKLHNVMKIGTIPIPFPYVQMSSFLLLMHWALTPIIASLVMPKDRWAACLAFMSVFCLWSIYYISQEIEQPFGDHQNALPCQDMQYDCNRILSLLITQKVQEPPAYEFQDRDRQILIVKQKTAVMTERKLYTQDSRKSLHKADD